MSNDIKFFNHDSRSRADAKIQKMVMKENINGIASIGIYWCIIEMLHEEHGYIMLTECERIAFELRVQLDFLTRVLFDYELFEKDSTRFWSNRVLLNLEGIYGKSASAKKSAEIRWGKINADALRTQSDGNAKRKGKESKVDEKKEEDNTKQTPFDLLWFKWVNYRTAIKKPIKPVSMELAKKELQDLSGGNFELAEKIVNQSIAKSWQGLFELKNSKNVTEEPVGKKLRTL